MNVMTLLESAGRPWKLDSYLQLLLQLLDGIYVTKIFSTKHF